MNDLKGKFIVLDGPDGCGKSTQAKLLSKWVQDQNVSAVTFRDPGTTPIGEKIRNILLDNANTQMSTAAEMLLYMAARAQLWTQCIEPALNEGKCVILDRWISSTCAYQGFAGGFGVDKIITIAQESLPRIWPDMTIILDIDLKSAAPRLKSDLDRMEKKGLVYHKKVRDGFLSLADARSGFAVVDASEDIKTVHSKVIEIITKKLLTD
ncbi:MAG: dTMP kinase [Planctomycetes bacterium]|nr:dTMP kinase [Planctomycetota bacterium]MBL7107558.1 dTMP kinase [Phycisphaerae bacterium]